MSVNPIDPTNTDKPTGSLEDLFRHHMAEAAVPPRPMLWDQIDNSLLLEQNAIYRRRLNAMRWVAAASLLLATLTGTGWLAMRDAVSNSNRMATTQGRREAGTPAGGLAAHASRSQGQTVSGGQVSQGAISGHNATASQLQTNAADAAYSRPASTSRLRTATPAGGNALARIMSKDQTAAGSPSGSRTTATAVGSVAVQPAAAAATRISQAAGAGTAASFAGAASSAAAPENADGAPAAGRAERSIGLGQPRPERGSAMALASASGASAGAEANTFASNAGTASAPALTELSLLTGRPVTLIGPEAAGLPGSFVAIDVPADGTPAAVPPARKWQFGASYTVGAFQPNTNFSRVGGDPEFDYNPALGANSPALSEAAAAEHLENLRPGVSHRVAVRATRRLGGKWALGTGAELSQSYARSASSVAFVGEQVPDFGPNTQGAMRTTDFRYRTAGIPVELQYANPVKRGWAVYGRVGAVVSALLGVRSDVEGIPEATRSYSVLSAGTPYRRVLTNVRGAAGAQFRPADGSWTFTLGPVAEASLLSLNAHPAQDFLGQSRAYNVGLEAGVEFGRSTK